MFNWYLRHLCADPNDPESYTSTGSSKPSCPGSTRICAIFAEDDGTGRPIITPTLQSQMVTALSTGVDQPLVLLRSAC
ncbi:hypothetical protein [Pedobacter sp. FW305-3-2-15-E-R2A2]|uniref:hypothetical protein n=1 Tax=Pedobacter sp. FW305-3-2-15-E-R2A2 TaxID=3140251 RepID=UPI00314026B7